MWFFKRWRTVITVFTGGLMLAGCGDLPQPFAPDPGRNNPVLAPAPDIGGIVISGIDGATPDMEGVLTERMIEILAEFQVPAMRDGANRNSHFLRGTIDPDRKITWVLRDRKGTLISDHTAAAALPETRVTRRNRAVLDPVLRRAAAKFADQLQRDRIADSNVPAFFLIPVEGLSSSRNTILLTALRDVLQRKGFRITETDTDRERYVSGSIVIRDLGDSQRRLNVTWSVLLPDGRLLGLVEQSNVIPASRLKTAWNEVSRAIAANAANGLSDLMIRTPPATK